MEWNKKKSVKFKKLLIGNNLEYYPIYVNLRNKLVLVLGQYQILEFKIAKLLEAGADIRFVSKSLSENIEIYIKSNRIVYYNDDFDEKYLEDVWLVICGSDDTDLKTTVHQTHPSS